MSSRCRLERGFNRVEVTRLHQVLVEAGGTSAAAIGFLLVAGDGNEAEVSEAGSFTQVCGELVAIHHRQSKVQERDVG